MHYSRGTVSLDCFKVECNLKEKENIHRLFYKDMISPKTPNCIVSTQLLIVWQYKPVSSQNYACNNWIKKVRYYIWKYYIFLCSKYCFWNIWLCSLLIQHTGDHSFSNCSKLNQTHKMVLMTWIRNSDDCPVVKWSHFGHWTFTAICSILWLYGHDL